MTGKYPIELRTEICSLVESKDLTVSEASKTYSIPVATIYTWLRQNRIKTQGTAKASNSRLNSHTLKEEDTATPIPRKLDFVEAVALWQLVRTKRADSPEVGLACRQHGIFVKNLLTFGEWVNKANNLDALANCLHHMNDANHFKQELAHSKSENSILEEDLRKRDQTLSELTTELLIRKKFWRS